MAAQRTRSYACPKSTRSTYAPRLEEWTSAAALAGASESLQAYVRSRQAQDANVTTEGAWEELATFGVGEVAEGVILDASAKAGHAAPTAVVYFGPVAWPAGGNEPGACELFVLGEKWRPSWGSRSPGKRSASAS